MGKGTARGYIQPTITVCDGCFHKDVCGDRDYLTENACSARAGGCYCRECKYCRAEAEEHMGYTPLVCMNANPEGEPVPTWQNCFCSKGEKEAANG